jgi:carbamoyl-phosphate synthase large subunit
MERRVAGTPWPGSAALVREAKRCGLSDRQLAGLWRRKEEEVTVLREMHGIRPVVKMVDTCAGEFDAATPYYYVTYDDRCEVSGAAGGGGADQPPADSERKPKVMILGSGPNRIGQGIEFDYCCVHAAMAVREMGMESIMVNCNPETVSTDFDVTDFLRTRDGDRRKGTTGRCYLPVRRSDPAQVDTPPVSKGCGGAGYQRRIDRPRRGP